MADKGYAGRIGKGGTIKVDAPYPQKGGTGKSSVKTGTDLRTGK